VSANFATDQRGFTRISLKRGLLGNPFAEVGFHFFLRQAAIHAGIFQTRTELVENVQCGIGYPRRSYRLGACLAGSRRLFAVPMVSDPGSVALSGLQSRASILTRYKSCCIARGANLEIQFECNYADYRETMQFSLKRTVGYYVLLVLGIGSVLIGSLVAYRADLKSGLVLQLLGLFWLSWPVIIRPLWLRRDYQKNPNFSVSQVVRVNDEGLHTVSDISDGAAKWSAFTRFDETENLFMLRMGARLFRVIPKRALSTAQVDELRELLRSKLHARLTRDQKS